MKALLICRQHVPKTTDRKVADPSTFFWVYNCWRLLATPRYRHAPMPRPHLNGSNVSRSPECGRIRLLTVIIRFTKPASSPAQSSRLGLSVIELEHAIHPPLTLRFISQQQPRSPNLVRELSTWVPHAFFETTVEWCFIGAKYRRCLCHQSCFKNSLRATHFFAPALIRKLRKSFKTDRPTCEPSTPRVSIVLEFLQVLLTSAILESRRVIRLTLRLLLSLPNPSSYFVVHLPSQPSKLLLRPLLTTINSES